MTTQPEAASTAPAKSKAAHAMATPLITVTAEPAAINGAGPAAAWSRKPASCCWAPPPPASTTSPASGLLERQARPGSARRTDDHASG